ncbi:hypothetical protein [Novosphingobium naphthalenivorans]|uniref:hypothetical protein n=1 Tax=Novosphingobium naphthalenivorans TaxID=273168 RepID=UPI00082DC7AE|nr:hypothetical protein [Novosphingobium naphthalenivorans]
MPGLPFAAALALCAAGPLLLRYGWQRQRLAVIAAWAAMALAAMILGRGEGAWGLAAGATVAMASAALVLGHAAMTTPAPQRTTPARVPAPLPLPPIAGRDMARRLGVFIIVVLLDLAAALGLAWALQRALFHAGGREADTTALALFAFPLFWFAAAALQMTCKRLAAMMWAPLAALSLGAILWLMI